MKTNERSNPVTTGAIDPPLTAARLAEIRARITGEAPTTPIRDRLDAHVLLAEVDRLTQEVDGYARAIADKQQEIDTLRAEERRMLVLAEAVALCGLGRPAFDALAEAEESVDAVLAAYDARAPKERK